MSYMIIDKSHIVPFKLSIWVTVSTPLGENIDINDVYRRVKLYIGGCESMVYEISSEKWSHLNSL